jgi:steroid delta-isomerase-like uncharacterized protein
MGKQNRTFVAVAILMGLLIGCGPSKTSQIEENKAVARRAVEALNNRDLDMLDEFIAKNYVRHSQATPEIQVRSLDDFKRFIQQDAATFPDSRMTMDLLVAEGDRVAFYGTYIGTQQGQMGPFPPSGKQMKIEFAGVHRFENGKIAETWVTWDNLSALTQLGYFPPPGVESEK